MLFMLARIETLKAVKRPAFWVTTGIFGVLCLFSTLAFRWSGAEGGLPQVWATIVEPFVVFGTPFMGVIVVLLVAPEFRWNTARQHVINGVSRRRFVFGKFLTLFWLVPLFVVIAVVVGGGVILARVGMTGSTLVGPGDWLYFFGFAVALFMWGAAGLLFATVVRSAGAGIGTLIGYYALEQLVRDAIEAWLPLVAGIASLLPVGITEMLQNPRLYYATELARELTVPDLAVPLVAAAAYAALFLGLAFSSMRRRDL